MSNGTIHIPEKTSLTGSFFAPSGRTKRTRPSAAEAERLEKRRASGRRRQEHYATQCALRGDASLNIIARALLHELLTSGPEELLMRKPVIVRTLALFAERGYRHEHVLQRMKQARRRALKRRTEAQSTTR